MTIKKGEIIESKVGALSKKDLIKILNINKDLLI